MFNYYKMTSKLLVFISGNGTNLQAIIDTCHIKVLDAKVIHVISNRKYAVGLIRARTNNIPNSYYPYISNKMNEDEYDLFLAQYVNKLDYDIIVFDDWSHIFGKQFLSNIKKPIITLHPTLFGQFPKIKSISDVYKEFKNGKCTKTDITVHYIVNNVDMTRIIDSCQVPILEDDSEEDLKNRIIYYEKPLLINAIQKELTKLQI